MVNRNEIQVEKLRKVKNYSSIAATLLMSAFIGWVLIYRSFPKHWEIVNGILREVLSGFKEFNNSNWMMFLGGMACIGFLWGIFVLSLKHPIGSGFIWILISFCVIFFSVPIIFPYTGRSFYKIVLVCSISGVIVNLIPGILNIRYGFQKKIEPREI